ncbi:MAG TPA: 2-amino-4-hydroxy-6-hydroxymethyldihydropteridine diphosphokinase [Chitinophagales bacterium]|nr:2-amino-4-hydroxy-6-hydroxymethyldihydropteridine diphosphokinase [Chitinophagales bacterium]
MHTVYLLLGTNLNNRLHNLQNCVDLLSTEVGEITAISWIYETEPWGNTQQNTFLNQVVCCQTPLEPLDLLEKIQFIEQQMGRKRQERWGPRLIDIDILFYEQRIVVEDNLLIPHPDLHKRRFTLVPLADLAPNFIHPILQKSVQKLLHECTDTAEVTRA